MLKRYDDVIVDCATAIILNSESQEAIKKLLFANRRRVRNEAAVDLRIIRRGPVVYSRGRDDGMIQSIIVLPEKMTTN